MIDKQALAQVFNDNLGNRLSVQLANGMLTDIIRIISDSAENQPEKDLQDTNHK